MWAGGGGYLMLKVVVKINWRAEPSSCWIAKAKAFWWRRHKLIMSHTHFHDNCLPAHQARLRERQSRPHMEQNSGITKQRACNTYSHAQWLCTRLCKWIIIIDYRPLLCWAMCSFCTRFLFSLLTEISLQLSQYFVMSYLWFIVSYSWSEISNALVKICWLIGKMVQKENNIKIF